MRRNYRITIMATFIAGLALLGQAGAASLLVGDDGIAASPKVRAQLNERKTRLNAATFSTASLAHRCANCTDTLVTVVDKGTKGPNHLVTKVARHNCAGCDTKIVTEGAGKAKKDVAIHTCNAGEKPLCCANN